MVGSLYYVTVISLPPIPKQYNYHYHYQYHSTRTIGDGLAYFKSNYPGFSLDNLIPSLVALPASVKGLGVNRFVIDGSLVIQDKASCFTSQILFDEWSQSVGKSEFIMFWLVVARLLRFLNCQ